MIQVFLKTIVDYFERKLTNQKQGTETKSVYNLLFWFDKICWNKSVVTFYQEFIDYSNLKQIKQIKQPYNDLLLPVGGIIHYGKADSYPVVTHSRSAQGFSGRVEKE